MCFVDRGRSGEADILNTTTVDGQEDDCLRGGCPVQEKVRGGGRGISDKLGEAESEWMGGTVKKGWG